MSYDRETKQAVVSAPMAPPMASAYARDAADWLKDVPFNQWTTPNHVDYLPAANATPELPPGMYAVACDPPLGLRFVRMPVTTDGLIRFPQADVDKVVAEIQRFWTRESVFHEYGLAFRRGILLHGPPGSGKSCAAWLVIKDVIDRGGVAVKFESAELFIAISRVLRAVHPDRPLVVLMEDLDALLQFGDESAILQVLDGVDRVHKCCFIATTNYPERLDERVKNRPSRFDKRFLVGHPNEQSRLLYFCHLVAKGDPGVRDAIMADASMRERVADGVGFPIGQAVRDSDGFSLAHLKELFTATVILGDSYDESLAALREMDTVQPDSAHFDRDPAGMAAAFRRNGASDAGRWGDGEP